MFTFLSVTGCSSAPEETPEPVEEVQPIEPVEPIVIDEPEEIIPEEIVEIVEIIDLTDENNALIADVLAAREKAVEAGAEEYLPNELLIVDIGAREAQVVYEEGGDQEVFNAVASDTLYQYMALEQGALAFEYSSRVDELGFRNYNNEQYVVAQNAAVEATELFNTGSDGETLYETAKTSADAYALVLHSGFVTLSENERADFLNVKEQADDIKAGVADKANYDNAVATFNVAETALTSGDAETAYNNFKVAKEAMDTVYDDVSVKRAYAQEALDRARQRMSEAAEEASAADTVVTLEEIESLDTADTQNNEDENTATAVESDNVTETGNVTDENVQEGE